MFSRKKIKSDARAVLKKKYFVFAGIVFFAILVGTIRRNPLSIFNYKKEIQPNTVTRMVESMFDGTFDDTLEQIDNYHRRLVESSFSIGHIEFGHAKGVLSQIVNGIASGSFLVTIFIAICGITGSGIAAKIIFAFLALCLAFVRIFFFVKVFQVVFIRFFLEGRVYEKIHSSSLLYLFHVKKWTSVSMAMFRRYVFETLWLFTIAGYPVKRYSYYLVPYILAENPTLSGKEAMALSAKMMNGHKWECFKLELSFLFWDILDIFTFGLLSFIYVSAYKVLTFNEYYVYVRNLAKEKTPLQFEKLNDKYLFEKADESLIKEKYSDVIQMMQKPDVVLTQTSKIHRFFASVFGVVLRYDDNEIKYRQDMVRQKTVELYKESIQGKSYAERLSPIPSHERRLFLENSMYLRNYSVVNLVLMFFIFCVVGWIWEVDLTIIEKGIFVNRGVLHGPWLPIYGAGGILILVLLKEFRKHPVAEFFSSVVLCGIVEYATSWFLEVTQDGTKWWDYTGYFLNINGRVCAEGLLVFGIAGCVAVYCASPLLDNLLSKIPERIAVAVSVILLAVFVADVIFSAFYPNIGEGITDYAVYLKSVGNLFFSCGEFNNFSVCRQLC